MGENRNSKKRSCLRLTSKLSKSKGGSQKKVVQREGTSRGSSQERTLKHWSKVKRQKERWRKYWNLEMNACGEEEGLKDREVQA